MLRFRYVKDHASSNSTPRVVNLTSLTNVDINDLKVSLETSNRYLQQYWGIISDDESGEGQFYLTGRPDLGPKFVASIIFQNEEKLFGKNYCLMSAKNEASNYPLVLVSPKFGVVEFYFDREKYENYHDSSSETLSSQLKSTSGFSNTQFSRMFIQPEHLLEKGKGMIKNFENIQTSELQPDEYNEVIDKLLVLINADSKNHEETKTEKDVVDITKLDLDQAFPNFREIPKVKVRGSTLELELHPDVFACPQPDIRLLHECVKWQETYKLVDETHRVVRDVS